MKQFATLLVMLTLASPVAAQDDDNRGLMERGLGMFMEGLRGEMGESLEGLQGWVDQAAPAMRDFLREMGPAFAELADEIKDWSAYHPPEILPNGDIIIRRKTPDPVQDTPQGQTDI